MAALIGESGSGKSTVSRLLSLLEWPTAGTVILNGETIVSGQASPLRRGRLLRTHSADVQLIFQDPFSSLNSNHTVGYHLERPLRIHRRKLGAIEDYGARVADLLEQVNLRPGASYAAKYPHELSGGQRQRVAIAARWRQSRPYCWPMSPFPCLMFRCALGSCRCSMRSGASVTWPCCT